MQYRQRHGVWRKGTRQDAKSSAISRFILAVLFIPLAIAIYSEQDLLALCLGALGLFFLITSIVIFINNILRDLPYEYYINVKSVNTHYKGKQVGLPKHFHELSSAQNEALEEGKFPNIEDLYTTESSNNFAENPINYIRNSISSSTIDSVENVANKAGKSYLIYKCLIGIVTSLGFLITFLTTFFEKDSEGNTLFSDMPSYGWILIIILTLVFIFSIVSLISAVIKNMINFNNNKTDNEKNYTEYVEDINQDYSHDEPSKEFKETFYNNKNEEDPFRKYDK